MKLSTICVQGAYRPKNGEPRVVPIVQSTTYKYDSSVEMGDLFDLKKSGYFYSRLQNPTCDTVAAKIAMLEGGVAGMLTGSGQAANFYAVFNIAGAGDHIVSSTAIYGGTYNLFNVTLRKLGIDFTFVSPSATEEELAAAIRPNTKAIFGETISNPSLEILDIEKFARVAHKAGVPLIVDNTFATPINCRPFDFGCDIVTHSTTKYMEGHASTVGGAIVDSGNFDWTKYPDKYPGLCTPDESYHGVTYTERFGLGGAFITKATVQLMRDFGATPAPMNSYLLNVGLETLHLRMPQHCANALTVAKYLKNHPKIAWVNCPSLEGDKYYELAQKYMPNGTCGVVTFGVQGGRKAAETFMAGLKLASIATHVADAKTCVLHPASSTHRQMSDAELMAAGVSPDLIRLSVGIEDVKDILADLEQARKALTKITAAIERKMRRQFLIVFEQVNANFTEIFSLLFPGGKAHLEMTDPDHLDETGVEIVAQPQGKRIQKMTLMSGGEKSLTALALLFAVYRTRTVPFYVFDEVEAALDDSNLSKLLDAIERLKETTQLIVISHQRRTMEQADVLYGVSMQADGVSHVVSQRLDQATGKVVDA